MNGRSCGAVVPLTTRRDVLRGAGLGFGWLAFSSLASDSKASDSKASEGPLAPKTPPLPARAKRVIFLCMRGGPSQVDTFDHKPLLARDDGKPGRRPGSKLTGSKWKFAQRGKSGLWMSDLFPELGKRADDLCVVNSMRTDLPAHPQAFVKLHTGVSQFVRPSLGAWTLYGLGTENQNLPGFVSLSPPSGFGGATNYGSGFLPAIYQGTRVGADRTPVSRSEVAHLKPRLNAEDQRAEIDFVQALNRDKVERNQDNPAVEGAIESFELAFRMQSEMPQAMDLSQETAETKNLYGVGQQPTDDMGRKCLLARRLVEAGVRFVEVAHGDWDHHFNLSTALERSGREVDRPIAGLLTDLAARDMLKDTLVVWTGEFGRTPHFEGQGRDHQVKAFSLWLAGGGFKGGFTYGKSDDYGYDTIENPMPVEDLHATMLAALGLDHERLTFKHAGRDFRLTDTKGRVANELFGS